MTCQRARKPLSVDVLRDSLPVITLILIVLLSFMLLVGSFHGDEEFKGFTSGFWKVFLTIVLFISVLLTFANFIETDDGDTWLEVFWDYVTSEWESGPVVSSFIFLAIIIFVMWFVGWGKFGKNEG